jgi:dienelactone hydrolase
MKRLGLLIGLMLAMVPAVQAEVIGREVDYKAGDTLMKGYLVFDDEVKGPRPGVLVVPEWWGLTDYARKRTRMLAGLGYIALAVDMYGDGKTAANPDEAGRLAGQLRRDLPLAKERFLAALELLKRQPQVNPEKIAAIGYCFGGGMVLEMARSGVALAGVVSFHGSLATEHPAKGGVVKARVLALNGMDDPLVPPEQVGMFQHEMETAGVYFRVVSYPGAKHSFTNPQADDYARKFHLPVAYDAEADKKSWIEMEKFLMEIFK